MLRDHVNVLLTSVRTTVSERIAFILFSIDSDCLQFSSTFSLSLIQSVTSSSVQNQPIQALRIILIAQQPIICNRVIKLRLLKKWQQAIIYSICMFPKDNKQPNFHWSMLGPPEIIISSSPTPSHRCFCSITLLDWLLSCGSMYIHVSESLLSCYVKYLTKLPGLKHSCSFSWNFYSLS